MKEVEVRPEWPENLDLYNKLNRIENTQEALGFLSLVEFLLLAYFCLNAMKVI